MTYYLRSYDGWPELESPISCTIERKVTASNGRRSVVVTPDDTADLAGDYWEIGRKIVLFERSVNCSIFETNDEPIRVYICIPKNDASIEEGFDPKDVLSVAYGIFGSNFDRVKEWPKDSVF